MKTLRSIFLFLFVILLTVVACQQPGEQIDLTEVREAIDAQNAKFVEAFAQGDAAGIAALYAEEAKLMPPNHQTIQGQEGIQQYWNMMMQMGIKNVSLSTTEINGSGGVVYEVGSYTIAIETPNHPVINDNGKYLVIWTHDDTEDVWKLQVDIWNSNARMPVPEMSEK